MAESSTAPSASASSSFTETVTEQPSDGSGSGSTRHPQESIKLKLKKPKKHKKVAWSAATVDNEHMNKKKSKCCCVFEKSREFGESSSDTDDECDHCRGHVEVKKHKKLAGSEQPSTSERDSGLDTDLEPMYDSQTTSADSSRITSADHSPAVFEDRAAAGTNSKKL